ncbi:MAG: pyridoxal phosphate-dependent aminotransferase [Clostridia bacterium]|nr:pyridoxal phosphate-dependent aminotransferase [Clostridia bacterium]MBQ5769571.1 pyridoxal phosphate-dependent aminotransferase [Clostridia bacterium]
MTISQKCKNIQPSVTLAIDSRAKQLRNMGLDVIGFGAGEPDFDTPKYIKDAARDALDAGMTKYTPVAGTVELRTEIQEKLLRDNGLDYELTDIIVSTGAKQSLFNALSAILDPGDEVLLPSPCWVSYPEMVQMAGGVPVMVKGDENNGFLASAEMLEKYVTEKTKALIINSPNNPNGSVYTRDMLEKIARLAIEKHFFVISDEIYEKLIYDGEKHVSIASLSDAIKAQTIVVNGVSKSYAMTGWRIGYAAGPKAVIRAMAAFQGHTTSNPNSIAQHAAAVALTNGERFMHESHNEFNARRKLMHSLLNAIPNLSAAMPQGAFYMMLNISGMIGKSLNGRVINGSDDFAEMLLESKLVAVVPARAFGDDHYVRLSYATSREKISVGIMRIAEFVKECK